ncbi:MAG: photosynthetic reaction center cytochrome c subunit [Acidobacteria bacterium]|nr:photosynthetic reaction center cytochrome c subunit [Acidobacteriota bacterium]
MRHRIRGAIAVLFVCLVGAGLAARQAAPQQPPMAEDVYLNVQVLRGMPVDRFNDTMGMFASALLLDCVGCHDPKITSDPKAFAAQTPRIMRARQMVVMMNALNKQYFGGQQRITCFTCHNGDPQPERSPSLRLQYTALVEDPTSIKFFPDVAAPPAEQTLAKYVQAMGGAGRLAGLTSFTGTGSYIGFETSDTEAPVQVFVRAPDQRALVVDIGGGKNLIYAFDGKAGWKYQPDTPVPLLELTGSNLTGTRIDTMAFFPAALAKAFAQWQTGFATIDDKEVLALRGVNPGQNPANLYFDASGLLIRMVRWNDTGAGPVPVQTDFSDFRDVAGVKMPYHWVTTWTNGQATIQLKEIRPNVAIDAARFARPNVAVTQRLR